MTNLEPDRSLSYRCKRRVSFMILSYLGVRGRDAV